jgi:hypothetical protein
MQRLGEQHVAELAGIHLNRRPGIQGPAKARIQRLTPTLLIPAATCPAPAALASPTCMAPL